MSAGCINLEFDYVTNASVDPFIDIFREELKLRKNTGVNWTNKTIRERWLRRITNKELADLSDEC